MKLKSKNAYSGKDENFVSGLLRQLQRNKSRTRQEERGAVLRSSSSETAISLDDQIDPLQPVEHELPASHHREPSWVRALTEVLPNETVAEKNSVRSPTAHLSLKAQAAEFQTAPWWLKDAAAESNPQAAPIFDAAVHQLLHREMFPFNREEWKTAVQSAVGHASDALKGEVRVSRRVLEQVEHDLFELVQGKGPLEPLFQDLLVTEVFVDHSASVRVVRSGHAIETPIKFPNHPAYELFLRTMLHSHRRTLSERQPVLDLVLDDKWGTRANVVHQVISGGDEPRMCFRVPRNTAISFFDVLQTKTLPATLAAWLAELVAIGEANVLITGLEGTGKTVFMTALLSAVGSDERVIAIEDFPEISIPGGHFERLVSCENELGAGASFDTRELVRLALRRSPHRLAMGVLNAQNSAAFLEALEGGYAGSVGSILGGAAYDALWRFADFVAGKEVRTPLEAVVRRISRTIHLVVTTGRDELGPCLFEVAEVLPNTEADFRLMPLVQYIGINAGKRQWQLKARQSLWLSRLKEQGLHLVPGPGLLPPEGAAEEFSKSGNIVG